MGRNVICSNYCQAELHVVLQAPLQSSFPNTILRVLRHSDCAALLVKSPHCALVACQLTVTVNLFFNTDTQWVQTFCHWQTLFFRQKCDKESVGQATSEPFTQRVQRIRTVRMRLVKVTATASSTVESPQHLVSFYFGTSSDRHFEFAY